MKEVRTTRNSVGIPDVALELILTQIDDSKDRNAVSLVCRRWHQLDASTRKHVTIGMCYTTCPEQLRRRFPYLESLKLKGKPRASMFNLIPNDWGGYATPWVTEIAMDFKCLKSLHFRRMIVNDYDLELIARNLGVSLQVLKLDQCSGFSTDGLLHVTQLCRNLKTLFLQESEITEKYGQWLHELANKNVGLETLNFYLTDLALVNMSDMEKIIRNCMSLVSLKISYCEDLDLGRLFCSDTKLVEFGGWSFDRAKEYSTMYLPSSIRHLSPSCLGINELPIVYQISSMLTKLYLTYTFLLNEDLCILFEKCPNVEVLETRNVIGDRGLEVLSRCCKKLKRLRIEHGADDEYQIAGNLVSHKGLIALARGCLRLEYLAVYVSDITNEALECIGSHSKNLYDFRLVLVDHSENVTDLPLDIGVRALLMGCRKLQRFALYLRPGGLTDTGLSYIGQYSINVRWMLLGFVGETDKGLLEFCKGCPNLQKLELRGCFFSERALAVAATKLTSLRYFWVQGYKEATTGLDLLAMTRPFWNVELVHSRSVVHNLEAQEGSVTVHRHPAHFLAYYSLAGRRTDCPEMVVPIEALALPPL